MPKLSVSGCLPRHLVPGCLPHLLGPRQPTSPPRSLPACLTSSVPACLTSSVSRLSLDCLMYLYLVLGQSLCADVCICVCCLVCLCVLLVVSVFFWLYQYYQGICYVNPLNDERHVDVQIVFIKSVLF